MDKYRVAMTILLPPPFPEGHPGIYGRRELAPLVHDNPSRRFAFVAGGESLNAMIQGTDPGKVTPEVVRDFEEEAETIVKAGAVGFGEFAAEHFSSGRGRHPYESARADHPLFLALADIAAKHAMPDRFAHGGRARGHAFSGPGGQTERGAFERKHLWF